jgi:hypothetical protein
MALMTRYFIVLSSVCLMTALLMSAGCTPLVEGTKKSANSLKKAGDETAATWRRLLYYDPPPTDPQPADTRYCYRYSSDIVCYDTPQPHLTSKIVGVQGPEGVRSVRYSEAAIPISTTYSAPVAPVNTVPAPGDVNSKDIGAPISTAPPLAKVPAAGPFHSGESPYSK